MQKNTGNVTEGTDRDEIGYPRGFFKWLKFGILL